MAAQTTAKKVTVNLHLNTNKCKQEIKSTSRSVASKVATGEDDGGDKDCSLDFRSRQNASAACSQRFFCLGTQSFKCDYCNRGQLDKADQSNYRKITIHSEKVGCEPTYVEKTISYAKYKR